MRFEESVVLKVHGVIPGSYQAYAWASAPNGGFRNNAFKRAFAGRSVAVKVHSGGNVKLDLKALDFTP
jgi:hypothetical protein